MRKRASLEKSAEYLQKTFEIQRKKVTTKEKYFFEDLKKLRENWLIYSGKNLIVSFSGEFYKLFTQLGDDEHSGRIKLSISDGSLRKFGVQDSKEKYENEIYFDFLDEEKKEEKKKVGIKRSIDCVKGYIDAVGFNQIQKLLTEMQVSAESNFIFLMVIFFSIN